MRDLRLVVLAGVALAAAGGERMHQAIVEHGRFEVALTLRVSVAVAMILGGIAIQLFSSQRRIGLILLAAAIVPCLSLLNATHPFVGFSFGWLALALTPALFSVSMLAFPTGRIDSPLERRFIGASLYAALLVGLAVSVAPGHTGPSWVLLASTLFITMGTALLIAGRASRVNPGLRGLFAPMVTLAVLYAGLTVAYVIAHELGWREAARDGYEIATLATALAIPLAVVVGRAIERMSLGRALAGFVSSLGREPASTVQVGMAETLNDPLLRIYYRDQETGEFLDTEDRRRLPAPIASRRRTVIAGRGGPDVLVDHDAELSGQQEFLRAAAATALLRVEREQLVAELASSRSKLEASHLRLTRAADEERRRIQRDLHDGAQQHLIGMHIKLELALDSLEAEPARSAGLLVEVGRQMGEAERDLRSLATHVFPPTLKEYGLVDALASAIRTMGLAVHLEAPSVGRQPPEVEMQVYFACLEALQNIAKHCGPEVTATLQIWTVDRQLCFELRDTGPGFERGTVGDGLGLENMADRLATIGGSLSVVGRPGEGTVVEGVAPLGPAQTAAS